MSKRSKQTQDSQQSQKKVCYEADSTQDLVGSGSSEQAAQVGIIEAVSLVNFMCHSKLDFNFGSNVNFVIGRNGSGKSAVLTGLVVGLGGKASVTSRGSNLKGFIKSGKHSSQVSVTLRNRGPDAYKPKDFGSSIVIERRFTTDGASSYKIKGQRGNVVSTKRDELVHILDQFNIQVDNPVSVLNQETSRNFLNSKNPRDKYQFFLKATQLEQIKEYYEAAVEQKNNVRDLLVQKRSVLKVIEKDVKEWEQKWRAHQCFEEQRNKIKDLQGEFSWAVVGTKEREVEQKEGAVRAQMEALPKFEIKLDEISKVRDSKKEKLNAIEAELKKVLDNLQNLTPESSQMKQVLDQQKKETMAKKLSLRKLMNDKATAQEEERSLLRHIEKLREAEETGAAVMEKEKRLKAIQALEEKRVSLVAQLRTKEVDLVQLNGSVEQYNNEVFSFRQEHNNLERQAENAQRNIRNLEGSRTNRFKRFGQYIPELLEKIEIAARSRQFQVKPKGPIGAHISLRDESWALPIEACLGNLMFSFCCDNHSDEKILIRLINSTIRDGPKPSIIVSKFGASMYDVERFRVRSPPHPSVLDILTINDPVIANCLIDQRSIESILLIAESREARPIMLQNPPRNCHLAYTKSGDRLHANPFRYYSSNRTRANILQGSAEEKIREVQSELTAILERKQIVSTNLQQAQNMYRNNQREIKNLESGRDSIRREIAKCGNSLAELNSIEDPEPVDVTALEDDIINQRQNQERLQLKISEMEEILMKEEERTLQFQTEYDSFRGEIGKLMEVSEPLKIELRTVDTELQALQQQFEKVNVKMNEQKVSIKQLEKEHAKAEADMREITSKAEKICNRVRTRRSPLAIENEINQIKRQLERAESMQGSKEEVTMRYLEVKRKYDEVKLSIETLDETYNNFDSSMNHRRKTYLEFRSQLTIRVRYLFMTSLAQRRYSGKMSFNHKKATLEIKVQPHENVQELNEDTRSLSGGERSFSTVCFILALWDAMESPFRMLDEFDVFMDMINRRISMDMMLDTAMHKRNTQFIFLTPQDMTSIRASRLVQICKMPDPVRGRNDPCSSTSAARDNEDE